MISTTDRDDWERSMSQGFVPVAVSSAAEEFAGTMDFTAISNDLAVTVGSISACVIEPTAESFEGEPEESIIFSMLLSGSGTVTQGSRVANLQPGTGALYWTNSPYVLEYPAYNHGVSVRMSLERVGLTAGQVQALTARAVGDDDVRFRVFHGFVKALADSWGEMPPVLRTAYVRTASELLTILLWELSKNDVAPLRSSTTAGRVREVVIEHLENPSLDISFIARVLGVSTRTVHASFSDSELSAADFIRRQRLDRASSRLLLSSRSILEIAIGVGFSDLSTFTRSFKREFGMAPGQWRAMHAQPAAA